MKPGKELEIKLSAPSAEVLEQIAADPLFAGGEERVLEQRSVYYDLPGLAKSSSASLRFRWESGRGRVTLKLNGELKDGIFSRTEYETDADSVEEGVALLREKFGLGEFFDRAGAPVPGVRAEFLRREKRVSVFGAEIELALDGGWLGGEDNIFFEAEGELISGDEAALGRLESYLKEKYSLEPQPKSKRARCELYRLSHRGL